MLVWSPRAGDALGLLAGAGFAEVEREVLRLSGRALAGLDRLGVQALTPRPPPRRAGIVAFETPRYETIGRALEAAGIQAWCKEGRVRVSPHAYCTDADVDAFCAVLAQTLETKDAGPPATARRHQMEEAT